VENSGRLYGGLSSGIVDFEAQKKVVKEDPKENTAYKHPECRVLDDGSGYEIYGAKKIQLYNSQNIIDIENSIPFK